jgi:hypothetical protein
VKDLATLLETNPNEEIIFSKGNKPLDFCRIA